MWPSTCHLLPSYRQVENWELCQKSKHQMMIDCLHFVPTPRLKSVQYQTMASVYLYMYSTRLDELLKRHFLYRMGAKSRKCDQVDQPFVFTLRGHSQTTLTTNDKKSWVGSRKIRNLCQRGQLKYPERGQKQTFFDPLPHPHLVHVFIECPPRVISSVTSVVEF